MFGDVNIERIAAAMTRQARRAVWYHRLISLFLLVAIAAIFKYLIS